MNHNEHFKNEYNRGLSDEKLIIQFLKDGFIKRGHLVKESSKDENIYDDIDVWVNSTPFSIKCYGKYTPQNFLCELETMDKFGQWSDSWFLNGKAKHYILWHKGSDVLYQVDKELLLDYIDTDGYDRITGLSADIKKAQENHRHRNVKAGLIAIHKLITAGVAKEIHSAFSKYSMQVQS
jgi:hypothetical protein